MSATGRTPLGEQCPRCRMYGFTCEKDGPLVCEARGRVRALGAEVQRRRADVRVEVSVGILATLREVRRARRAHAGENDLGRRVALARAVDALSVDLAAELEDAVGVSDDALDEAVGDVCQQKVDGPDGRGRGVFYWRSGLLPGHSYCGRPKGIDADVCAYCEAERPLAESADLDEPVPFVLAPEGTAGSIP